MNMNRVNELITSMNSFGKEVYHKSELLDEMFALQSEIVNLTFNEDHATTADLKIWDVEKHLEQLNSECGNVADVEFEKFKSGCKVLCNLIKAEISGNRGEHKAFRTLAYLQKDHIILKNVELKDEDLRTEVDAVVINPAGITIIEVKNTSRDIFIDEEGNYYRTGEFLNWDCNILEKLELKEKLIRKALTKDGIGNAEIKRIVVFTDSRIKVQNKCSKVKTCFVSQIAYIIDDLVGDKYINRVEMEHIEEAINESKCKEAYPFNFDVAQFKSDFATLMVILEEAKAKSEEPQNEALTKEEFVEDKENGKFKITKKNILTSKYAKYAGSFCAGVTMSLIAVLVAGSNRKDGK